MNTFARVLSNLPGDTFSPLIYPSLLFFSRPSPPFDLEHLSSNTHSHSLLWISMTTKFNHTSIFSLSAKFAWGGDQHSHVGCRCYSAVSNYDLPPECHIDSSHSQTTIPTDRDWKGYSSRRGTEAGINICSGARAGSFYISCKVVTAYSIFQKSQGRELSKKP